MRLDAVDCYASPCMERGTISEKFLVTANGGKLSKKMTEPIIHFLAPTSIIGIRSWFGLVNQVSYAFSQTEVMAPFRELLRTKNRKFFWDETLEHLFRESKLVMVQRINKGVKTFVINRTTCLATDHSKTWISYFLFQKHCNCPGKASLNCGDDHWKLILAGSCFTNNAESCYAPIEEKALAFVFGLESCRMDELGCPDLLVTVDYQPLLNFKERTLIYKFRIKHRPGKLNEAPDCVSQYQAGTLSENTKEDDHASEAQA